METKPMESIREIPINLLDAHPDNPRIVLREDVVLSIAQQIIERGSYAPEHAILCRPVGDRYQILSGHHRVEGAGRAQQSAVPAWVREMSDEEAFMQLVLANAQGELTPLEIGIHALKAVPPEKGGRGKKGGLSNYAAMIGKSHQWVSLMRQAATVASAVQEESRNLGCGFCLEQLPRRENGKDIPIAKQLSEIHDADGRAWRPLVLALIAKEWSVEDTKYQVKRLAEIVIPDDWASVFLPYVEVVERVLASSDFSPKRADALAKQAGAGLATIEAFDGLPSEKIEAACAEFLAWLQSNRPGTNDDKTERSGDSWDARAIQGKSTEIVERLKKEMEAAEEVVTESWNLGDWRQHVEAVKDGDVALLLTDPPYGMEYQSDRRVDRRKDRRHDEIANDGKDAAVAEIAAMAAAFSPKLAADAHVLCFCHWSNEQAVRDALTSAGLKVRGSLVWVKDNAGMGDPHTTFAPMHERIIHAVKGSPVLYERERDVLQAARTQNENHPTEKPTELLKRLIVATTAKGQLVVDPFGGVASSLVAAKELERRYWGCELNEKYHAAGKERVK
jgi:ParB/RepB/Spo0J family partition protein